jgi:FKBP-type peptidyl-prolyl cis-trans isomerase
LLAATTATCLATLAAGFPHEAAADKYVDMAAIKGRDYGKSPMKFEDYESTPEGLQYKDIRVGTGPSPSDGDTCVIDWQGYTIGYYGRIFESRNKVQAPATCAYERQRDQYHCSRICPVLLMICEAVAATWRGRHACARSSDTRLRAMQTKGGSFEGADKVFLRLKLGRDNIVPGVEQALRGMKVGGYRRVIIPENLGYPNYDFNSWAPRPTTFSGQRTLDFVLKGKGMIDKTLLIDLELIKIT